MLNNSPWLWNARKTAAGMTALTQRGIRILKGKRAKGQSNPSPEYLLSQRIARVIWPLFRAAEGFVREFWTRIPTGSTAAAEFYGYTYKNAIDISDPLDPVYTPVNMLYATGTMTSTQVVSVTADVSANAVNATFLAGVADASQALTDVGWFVIKNRANANTISGSIGAVRATGLTGAIVATGLSMGVGDNIDVYIHWVGQPGAANEGLVSDSRYQTIAAVA